MNVMINKNIEEPISIGDMVGFINPKLPQITIVSNICTTNPEIYMLEGLGYSAHRSDLKKLPFKNGDYIHFKYFSDEWLILFKSYHDGKINAYFACVIDTDYVDINAIFAEYKLYRDVRYMTPSEIELLHKSLLKKGLVWSNDAKMIFPAPLKEKEEKRSFWKRISNTK